MFLPCTIVSLEISKTHARAEGNISYYYSKLVYDQNTFVINMIKCTIQNVFEYNYRKIQTLFLSV